MTSVIQIDESGDTGSGGSECFTIAAIVMMRPRHLRDVSDLIDRKGNKWYDSNHSDRVEILDCMSHCRFKVVYSTIRKNNPKSMRFIYGNDLYEMMLRQVIADAMSVLDTRDVNVFVDRSRFIKIDRLRDIAREESSKAGVNMKRCDKTPSEQTPCGRIVDFVAGAVRSDQENGTTYAELLGEKVSVARRY